MNSPRFLTCLCILYTMTFFASAAGHGSVMLMTADTPCYFEFGNALRAIPLDGAYWRTNLCAAARTPGFPLAVILGEQLFGDTAKGLLIVHFAAGISTMLLAAAILREQSRIAIVACSLIIFQFTRIPMIAPETYHNFAATEWLAMQAVIALFFIAVSLLAKPSRSKYFGASLLTSIGVLTRPNLLIPLLVGVAVLLFLARDRKPAGATIPALAGFLPLILWCAFNFTRFGTISVAPYAGLNALGIAGMLGPAEVRADDQELVREFITRVNALRMERVDVLEPFAPSTLRTMIGYNTMMWDIGVPTGSALGVGPATLEELATTYSQRVLISRPLEYLRYVINQLQLAKLSLTLLLVALASIFASRRRGIAPEIAGASVVICTVHGLCILSYAMISVELQRYVDLTGIPMLVVTSLNILLLLSRKRKPETAQ